MPLPVFLAMIFWTVNGLKLSVFAACLFVNPLPPTTVDITKVNHDWFEVVICTRVIRHEILCKALISFWCDYRRSCNFEAYKNLVHRNFVPTVSHLFFKANCASLSKRICLFRQQSASALPFTCILSLFHTCQFRTVSAAHKLTDREGEAIF